jgi:hypothetical protein
MVRLPGDVPGLPRKGSSVNTINPMLAELHVPPKLNEDGTWEYPTGISKPDTWAFEFKWDGHRIIAMNDDGAPLLFARSGRNVTNEYPEIALAVGDLPHGTILDGEAIALVNGKSNLQALAGRARQTAKWRADNIRYMAFDILADDIDEDLMVLSLIDRKTRLEGLLGKPDADEVIQLSTHVTDPGIMWPLVVQYELEGMIAKPLASTYRQGERGTWLKIKLNRRSEFTVVGYTQGTGMRTDTLGALLLAEPIPLTSDLRFSGKCGTGFSGTEAAQLVAAMAPLRSAAPLLQGTQLALAKTSSPGTAITWISEGLKVTVEYAERSDDEMVRYPSFKGVASYAVPAKPGWMPSPTTPTPSKQLPPAPPRPTGQVVTYSGGGRKPQPGDVFLAPGSSGMRNVVVVGGDKGLYLKCDCPAGKFVWKGGSFSPCKHMKYVLQNDLAGNKLIDGMFA